MQQQTILVDAGDFDTVKREVAARYSLGQILNVENMDANFSPRDYSHVIFNGYEQVLICDVIVAKVGEKFEVRIFPKSIERIC